MDDPQRDERRKDRERLWQNAAVSPFILVAIVLAMAVAVLILR